MVEKSGNLCWSKESQSNSPCLPNPLVVVITHLKRDGIPFTLSENVGPWNNPKTCLLQLVLHNIKSSRPPNDKFCPFFREELMLTISRAYDFFRNKSFKMHRIYLINILKGSEMAFFFS